MPTYIEDRFEDVSSFSAILLFKIWLKFHFELYFSFNKFQKYQISSHFKSIVWIPEILQKLFVSINVYFHVIQEVLHRIAELSGVVTF